MPAAADRGAVGDERVEQGGGQARPRGTPRVARHHRGGEPHGVTRRVPERHQPEPGGGAHLVQQRGERRDGRGGDGVEQRGLVGEHPDGARPAPPRRATARPATRAAGETGGTAVAGLRARRGGGVARHHPRRRADGHAVEVPLGRAVHRERIGAEVPGAPVDGERGRHAGQHGVRQRPADGRRGHRGEPPRVAPFPRLGAPPRHRRRVEPDPPRPRHARRARRRRCPGRRAPERAAAPPSRRADRAR